jgi:hypothetical protein
MTLAEARLARVTWRAQVKGGQHPRLVRAALAPGPIPQRPRAFIANIVAALQPFMDEWTRREGVTDAEVYEALRPFFAGYTVGDAALMLAQLGAALFATPGETAAKGDSPAFGALCEAKHMLEDFAVEARASGPDCVGARAFLLKNAGTDEGLVCESNLASIHASIRWDTSALRRGNFDGETFDSPSRNGSLNWLVKARERREQRNAGQNSQ